MKRYVITGIMLITAITSILTFTVKSQTKNISSRTDYYQQLSADEKALFYGALTDFLKTEYRVIEPVIDDSQVDVYRIGEDEILPQRTPLTFLVKGVGKFYTQGAPHKFVYVVHLDEGSYIPAYFKSSFSTKVFSTTLKRHNFSTLQP